jgi:hypothetical protein
MAAAAAAQPQGLKQRANAAFAEKRFQEALELYTQ